MVWEAGGRQVDARLLALLRALQRNPTLKAAAHELDISYRAAWGLLLDGASLAGAPLVEMQRGRGARLTRLGSRLLRADEQLRKAVEPLRARFELKPAPSGGAALRLTASHDPLLAQFCERFAVPAGLVADVTFRGSEDCLALFSRGATELAGFHLEGFDIRRFVQSGRDALIRFAERDQGLMVAHGNPKRLASMADVARSHARFVNRRTGAELPSISSPRLSAVQVKIELEDNGDPDPQYESVLGLPVRDGHRIAYRGARRSMTLDTQEMTLNVVAKDATGNVSTVTRTLTVDADVRTSKWEDLLR